MIAASATYLRAAVFCVLLVICALLVVVGAQAQPNRPDPARSAQATVCFPARSWDANPQDRPCVTTHQPQEDGSVRIVQGTPRRAVSVCILPNPKEERGRYAARCYRK